VNLFADEGVEREVVERLRTDGHTVAYVAELSPSITDDEVLDQANTQSALLVTADKDFGELVYRLGRVHAGVVLIRLAGLSPTAKADAVSELFRDHATELVRAFCVIAPGSVRIRRPSMP
jgi:predicted nuclease of predicted toxin-antitoxin system